MQVLLTLLFLPVLQALVAAIVTLPTWLLWNWIAVDIFELPGISLLQSFGLVLLVNFLFGGKLKIERS